MLGALSDAAAQVPRRREQAPDRDRVEAEATGQAAEADRLFKAGEFVAALPLYEAERASRAALGDRRYEAYALRAAGCCHFNLGHDDPAIAVWLDARKIDARRDDRGFEGYDLLLIGRAHLRRGRLAESVASLREALPLLSKAVDRDHEADARLTLANALLRLGQPAEAVPVDGAEALAKIEQHRPDVAVVDVMMPRLTGLEVVVPGGCRVSGDRGRALHRLRRRGDGRRGARGGRTRVRAQGVAARRPRSRRRQCGRRRDLRRPAARRRAGGRPAARSPRG